MFIKIPPQKVNELKKEVIMVIIVSATKDKNTKNKYRFIIDDNEDGVSGIIYLDKAIRMISKNTNKIKAKIKIQ